MIKPVTVSFLLILSQACTDIAKDNHTAEDTASTAKAGSGQIDHDTTETIKRASTDTSAVFSNERFRNVRVKTTGENQFLVTGQGQIFEASFSWKVEDGHDQIAEGFATTDAGAPAWGNFSFTVTVQKKRPESTLHLVLYEASAKDGSPQYQLPVPLY